MVINEPRTLVLTEERLAACQDSIEMDFLELVRNGLKAGWTEDHDLRFRKAA